MAQASAGDPGRRADGGLRVLRPDVYHPVFQGQSLLRHTVLQRHLRRPHYGRYDHPYGSLGKRGRYLHGAALSKGRRLRSRCDQTRDGDEGRCARRALGYSGGRDPRHLAGHRGDHDSYHRDGGAGELARQSPGRHAGDDSLHRPGRGRGDAARFGHLRIHLRGGVGVVRDDPGPQPRQLLVRPALQGDLLMTQSSKKTDPKVGGASDFRESVSTRYGLDRAFTWLVTAAALVGVAVLVVLLVDVTKDGSPMLSLEFLTSFPSQVFPENGGIYPALIGSLWLLGLTGLLSVPLGLGAAVYLEEYAQDTRINRMIEINISNLAGVPSVIYGLLGLGIFVELLAPVTGAEACSPARSR